MTDPPDDRPTVSTRAAENATADCGSAPPSGPTFFPHRNAAPGPLPAVSGYDLEALLGYGGMGVVYKARHHGLNRVVALKMVLAGVHARPEDLARFLAEAETAAHLQHQGIAQIYDTGRADGLPYYAMEYAEGGSLADRLRSGPLPPREAARTGVLLARAVAHAHAAGVIHRDLKPGNILLAADGTPKITDFGLAKRLEVGSGLTVSGAVLGTPSYMSPEQARGDLKAVGPPGDVYALGAVLYEMLTGRPPFRSDSPLDTLGLVLSAPPERPRALVPAVPRDLETVALTCLEKDPGKRYPSADALADDLQRYLGGRAITARRVSRAERVWRWAKRNPAVAALSAVVFASLATGAAVATVLAVRADASAAQAREEKVRADASAAETAAALARESEARRGTEAALDRERAALADRRGQIVRLDHATARVYADRGDHARALHWVGKAWADDRARPDYSPEADEAHRLRTGAALEKLPELVGVCFHDRPVTFADLSADGRRVVSLVGDQVVRVWDVDRGELAFPELRHPVAVTHAAFDPEGRVLATAAGATVRIWDARTGKPVAEFPHPDPVAWVAFAPKGARLATAAGSAVRVWDAPKPEPVLLVDVGAPVDYVGYSPDGGRLATASPAGTARVWSAASGEPLSDPLPQGRLAIPPGLDPDRQQFERRRHRPVFSPDGARVLTADAGAVYLWERGAPKRLPIQEGKGGSEGEDTQLEPAFLSQNQVVVCIRPAVEVVLLDLVSSRRSFGSRLPRQTACARVAPGRDRLAVATTNGGVHFLAAPAWAPASVSVGCDQAVTEMRFSIDGRRLMAASLDGTVRVWATPGGARPAYEFDCGHADRLTLPDRCIAPDGARTATRTSDGVRVAPARKLDAFVLKHPQAQPVRFSPDGSLLVTHSPDELRVWDVAARTVRLALPARPGPVAEVFFSDDGRWMAVRRDPAPGGRSEVRVWDMRTGQPHGPAHALDLLKTNYRSPSVLAPDGGRLAVPDRDDKVYCLTADGGAGPTIDVKKAAYINGISYTADAAVLAVAASDRTVRQYRVPDLAPAGPVVHTSAIPVGIRHAAGDRWLLAVTEANLIEIYDTRTGDQLAALGPFPFVLNGRAEWISGHKFDVWLAADGRRVVAHCRGSRFVTQWRLPRHGAAAEHWDALAALLTGLRLEEHGHLSPVDSDTYLANPEARRRAWRAWRAWRGLPSD